ncbi:hypothetical protein OIDMADRAFT_184419 [Oidiodendron maius Zn]|uniref:Uncharacterized protein n=1 Tax=Oidiodendron maius (strain Zn) TaxID=913774 RepID=A0A0C3GSR9_OIDMZ|nr:hypothetical protein OIDMADRAFT_184419 [Oidiodendron maius Zn]
MKFLAIPFAVLFLGSAVFAAPIKDNVGVAERDGEICCLGDGVFYEAAVEEGLTQ